MSEERAYRAIMLPLTLVLAVVEVTSRRYVLAGLFVVAFILLLLHGRSQGRTE